MRLLKLEIENLNSIYGKQEVDFIGGLKEAPLFLICGPTGAGKSTILDAISLALFGSTPRLNNSRAQEDNADSQASLALSRGMAYARAELTFRKSSPGEGPRTYRATWEVWRGNRQRPTLAGNLQGPYRRLEAQGEAEGTWVPLADEYPNGRTEYQATLSRVLEKFTREDFNRCMLLAQGEFAAFLEADESQRAEILERLTQTAEYKRIGGRAAARCSAARVETKVAEAAVAGVRLLQPEQVAALRAELKELERLAGEARGRVETARTAATWLAQEAGLAKAAADADGDVLTAAGRLEQEAPALAALAAWEQAAPALAALAQARACRAECTARERSLAQAEDELGSLETRLAELAEPLAQAGAQVLAARAERQEREPGLQQARVLRTRLGLAEGEADKARGLHGKAEDEAGSARKAWTAAAGKAQKLKTEADAATLHLQGQPWAALAAELGGLEARTGAILAREAALAGDRTTRDRLAADIAKEVQACATLRDSAGRAEAALATLQGEFAACERELAGHLAEAADMPETRRRLEAARKELEQRRGRLETLVKRLREAEAGAGRAGARRTEQGACAATLATLRDTAASLAAAAAEAAAAVTRLKTRLDLMRWARDLVQGRDHLVAGEACPLCGATAHPALQDPGQEAKDLAVKTECDLLEGQLAEAEQCLEDAGGRAAEAGAAATGAAFAAAEAARRVQEAEEEHGRLVRLAEEAAPPAAAEPRLEPAEAAQAAVAAELARLEAALDELDRAHGRFTRAKAARDTGDLAARDTLARLQLAEAKLAGLKGRLTDEDARLAEVGRLRGQDAQGLQAELQAHGLGGGLPEALAEAKGRVGRYAAALDRSSKAEAGLEQAALAETLAGAALEAAQAAAVSLGAEAEARQAASAAAQLAVAGALAGQDPEVIQQSLDAAIQAAETGHRKLEGEIGKTREARDTAQGLRTGALAEQAKAGQARDTAEAALRPLLAAHGDEAALEALALTAERAAALGKRRTELQRACDEALGRQGNAAGQLAAHRLGRPETLAAGATAGALQEALAEVQGEERRLNQDAGAVRNQLSGNDAAVAALGDAQARLQAAQKEEALWTRMNDLIGTGAGDAFKKYAQVLNLRDLLDKANARMAKLRPRYRLVPAKDRNDADRLALAIEDRDHAGEVGSVKGISGGESFLVSLCLALALADYRTVRMPVETLLLDEGFGTLDRVTLSEVMGLLNALTGSSTQIGIISHVESLQESSLPRIRVEPQGMGRSRILVEGA